MTNSGRPAHGHLQALARLWRVAHFVLSDFLNLSLQQSAETSSPLLGLNMAPAESLMVENPSHATARSGQRPAPTKSAGKSTHDKYEAANMASNDAQPPGKGATPAWPAEKFVKPCSLPTGLHIVVQHVLNTCDLHFCWTK